MQVVLLPTSCLRPIPRPSIKNFRMKVAIFGCAELMFGCLLDMFSLQFDSSYQKRSICRTLPLSSSRPMDEQLRMSGFQGTAGDVFDPRVATIRTRNANPWKDSIASSSNTRVRGPGWPLACRGWCWRSLLHDVGKGRRREGRRGHGAGRARRDGDASFDGVRRTRSLRRRNLAPEKKSLKWTSCRRASRSTRFLRCWRS